MNWFWLIVSSLVRFLLFGFSLLNDSTGLWYFVDVETETYRDWEIYWISRPRLIETERFLGCRDRDSSRLRNFSDVETETHRDWKICWMSRPRPVETGPKMSIPRLHRDSRSSLGRIALIFFLNGRVMLRVIRFAPTLKKYDRIKVFSSFQTKVRFSL